MPIELRELVIKATVEGQPGAKEGAQAGAGAKPNGQQRQQIVAECVEQVMEIMRQRSQR